MIGPAAWKEYDNDAALQRALFRRVGRPPQDLAEPDWPAVAQELKRPGVTLTLLWQKYRAAHPEGYGYTWFCEQYGAFKRRANPSFRHRHEAGDHSEPVNHVLPAWDIAAGLTAAVSLLAALRNRDATDEGSELQVPLSNVAFATLSNLGNIGKVATTGKDRPRYGNALYGLFGRDFKTADGRRVMITAMTRRQWLGLVEAPGLHVRATFITEGNLAHRSDSRWSLHPGQCWPDVERRERNR